MTENKNANASNTRARPTQAFVDPRQPRRTPQLGEVRYHAKNGLLYIYQVVPGKERLGWLRLDTWALGGWRRFPRRTADTRSLRKFNRASMGLDTAHDTTYVHIAAE